MRISDILLPRSVLAPLPAGSREEAIRALSRALPMPTDCQQEIEMSALARERAGSTGIGGGVALPHGGCHKLESPLLAIGRAVEPIDFHAPDGAPVDLVYLLAVPQEKYYCHLYPLATLCQLPGDAVLMRRLRAAQSSAKFFELIAALPV
jgi:mannitol/fructose-specific phosphotransferase system IIA component (Ntr-type)